MTSRERIDQAAELVIGRGQRAGVMRDDISGADLMNSSVPMCANARLSEDQGKRLLTIVLDGLRVSS